MESAYPKEIGAYYTPDPIAAALVKWVIRRSDDLMLDPACGDGRFIAQHHNSVGIEQHSNAVKAAIENAPRALVHEQDFFLWARNCTQRFDCAAGNPPFIRYQTFKGKAREHALALCTDKGATFSGLTSSWAPFLVATASLLKPNGRMAFVVPAEIGHAPYAAPLIEYLIRHFETVHVIAVKEKLFPQLSEDCWLLYADGFGGSTDDICFTSLEAFKPSFHPPKVGTRISLGEWRETWRQRLRPFLLPEFIRALYREVAERSDTLAFGDFATIGIGYVSGDNKFFHLRPSVAAKLEITDEFLYPTVRNGRVLPAGRLTPATVDQWRRADDAILLLNIPKQIIDLPRALRRYLDSEDAHRARIGYKCSNREPWYSVPDIRFPDFFLTYMSGRQPSLVRNEAGCTCTNSVHSVRLKTGWGFSQLVRRWNTPFARLSCEIQGHPLGGGLLKLEPREATAVLLPDPAVQTKIPTPKIIEGLAVMQEWRHYAQA